MSATSDEISGLLSAAVGAAPGPAQDALYRTARVLSLRSSILACERCELSQNTTPVPWSGGPSDIAIIGEAPGAEEARIGRPFVGRSGQLLDRLVTQVGLDRTKLTYINTVCCRPPSNDYGKAVDAGAPLACRPWLNAQIELSAAWILVPVGNQALWATLPHLDSGITGHRGKPVWRDTHLIVPSFHPSYALRNGDASEALRFDLARVAQILAGEYTAPVPKSYNPAVMISALRRPEARLTAAEAERFRLHFSAKGWVRAYSHWLEDDIVCIRDDKVQVPAHILGVRYTVAELVQLSHFDRSWATARRIHYTKREFGATIV